MPAYEYVTNRIRTEASHHINFVNYLSWPLMIAIMAVNHCSNLRKNSEFHFVILLCFLGLGNIKKDSDQMLCHHCNLWRRMEIQSSNTQRKTV